MFIDSSSIGKSGKLLGFWTANTTMFTAAVTVATGKMMLETKTWTTWSWVFFFISYLLWFLAMLVWSSLPLEASLPNDYMWQVAQTAFGLPQFWLVVTLATVLCIYPTMLWKFMKKMYHPTRYDMIQEIEMQPQCCWKCTQYSHLPFERKKFIKEMEEYQKSLQQPKIDPFEKSKQPKIHPGPDGGTGTILPSTSIMTEEKVFIGEDEEEPTSPLHIVPESEISPPRMVRAKTDLGFSEFQVGREHDDFFISQEKYMKYALSKKTI
eukprot:64566_1